MRRRLHTPLFEHAIGRTCRDSLAESLQQDIRLPSRRSARALIAYCARSAPSNSAATPRYKQLHYDPVGTGRRLTSLTPRPPLAPRMLKTAKAEPAAIIKIQPAPESSQRNHTPNVMQTLTRNSTGPLQQRNDCLRRFLLISFATALVVGMFSAPIPVIRFRPRSPPCPCGTGVEPRRQSKTPLPQ